MFVFLFCSTAERKGRAAFCRDNASKQAIFPACRPDCGIGVARGRQDRCRAS
jgi:hypothetical protein